MIEPVGTAANPEDDSQPYWVDLDVDPVPHGDDLKFGKVTFFRHKSPDGVVPEIFDPGDGGGRAVRLAVRADSYRGRLDDPADSANDRCELRGPKQKLGVDVWNAFSIRVPADFPVLPLRCVVAQMKMPYDAGGDGSPAFALRIDSGQWLVTVEHLYEFEDQRQNRFLTPSVDGRCSQQQGVLAYDHSNFNKHDGVTEYQVRAYVAAELGGPPDHILQAAKSCTTGVHVQRHADLPTLARGGDWTDFMVHMRSSGAKKTDGLMELYVNGALLVSATGEFGYPDVTVPPEQYFKVGIYRNDDKAWGPKTMSLEYRNIRRGRTLDDVILKTKPQLVALGG